MLRAVALVLLLSGCATYEWRENQRVDTAVVHKIETAFASEFCTKLLGAPKRACAIRLTNTGNSTTTCVIVMLSKDGEAAAHEAGGHCMGYDH